MPNMIKFGELMSSIKFIKVIHTAVCTLTTKYINERHTCHDYIDNENTQEKKRLYTYLLAMRTIASLLSQ
jgi:hypothetical protein